MKTAVLLCNLGTPEAPTPAGLRRYLREFLSDPRVIEIPMILWKIILHGIILRTRPAQSAAKYASIWMPEGSPLRVYTERQAKLLQGLLGERGHAVSVRYAMRYGSPSIASELSALSQQGFERVLVLPAYPQYSAATTASVVDAVSAWTTRTRRLPELRFVNQYFDDPAYINALADSVRNHWAREGRGERLLMSFHGMPARTAALGDPYHAQCMLTGQRLADALGLSEADYQISFQSRFGRARWLEPYTVPSLEALARSGVRSVDVICPGFSADCLETLEEINMEARLAYMAAGGRDFAYIPCLNDSSSGMRALTALAIRQLQGWTT